MLVLNMAGYVQKVFYIKIITGAKIILALILAYRQVLKFHPKNLIQNKVALQYGFFTLFHLKIVSQVFISK